MQLNLVIENKQKTFIPTFISGRIVRDVTKILPKLQEGNITTELIDELVGMMTVIYSNQFTVDEFYDGIEASKLLSTITDTLNFVMYGITTRIDKLPKNE